MLSRTSGRLSLAGLLLLHTALLAVSRAAEGLDPAVLATMDAEVNHAISQGKLHGGVLWMEHRGESYCRAYGDRAVTPEREPMTTNTVFDAASLTKVLATAPAIMILVERGQLKLDEPAKTYLPAFAANGKEGITIRHLLTHTSGLRPGLGSPPSLTNYAEAIALACAEKPLRPPGTSFRYSDINFITLGEIVRRVSGTNEEVFASNEVFAPLKMDDTGYLPPASTWPRTAPTERVSGRMLRGVVHDPTARKMGGVAGHAGVFTTAADLARFARMWLGGGELDGVRILRPETVKLLTSVQSPDEVPARRGLGWDIDTAYSGPRGEVFPLGSYGHTGFTGTSIWIDPFSDTFWIFLANSVHPDGKGNILALRKALGTLAARAVRGFDFQHVAGALPSRAESGTSNAWAQAVAPPSSEVPGVLNGIDVLARENYAPLKGLKLGLITNHTGQNRQRRSTIDLLRGATNVQLKALFSPEHGLYGLKDEAVADGIDARTGLPVFSLYGTNRAPTAAQLRGLDALVFDLQDVGCRFYTYPATMALAMEAAARAGLRFFVLDRVNPIDGATLDGPVLSGKTSFVAFHPVPVRHGMTVGELAKMYAADHDLKLDLTVVPVEGWTRSTWFDGTGLPWVNPSPNMRSLAEAALYPGVCLLEFCNVSVGRGTGMPFEMVGAPYIDDTRLAWELNQAKLPGVRFSPVQFTPTEYIFKGTNCGGVNLILTDRGHCPVVDVGITLVQVLHRLYPERIDLEKVNRLLGHRATLTAIKEGKSLAEIHALWAEDAGKFARRREAFLIYR